MAACTNKNRSRGSDFMLIEFCLVKDQINPNDMGA